MENQLLVLPEKQPYEGRATQKQKQKLWELGFRDQEVINKLGKRQASFLIDQLLFPRKTPEFFRRMALKKLIAGGLVGCVGLGIFLVVGGLSTFSAGSFFGVLGMIAGFLISVSGMDCLVKSKKLR